MKHYALDSSFVINFLKGKESAKDFYKNNQAGRNFLPSPVILESKRGIENLGNFEKLETLAFQKKEAEEALEIIDYLREKGEMIGIIDVMIASISITNSVKLATYDSDFKKLSDYEKLEYELIE